MPILDLNDQILTSANIAVNANGSRNFNLYIEPTAASILSANIQNPDLTVSARLAPGDAWQNLESAPLNLSAFANTKILVYFQIEAAPGIDSQNEIAEIVLSE